MNARLFLSAQLPKVPAMRSLGEVGLDELNEVLAA